MWKWVFFLFLFITASFAADLITKVIPLTYIDAKTAEQALKPLLKPGESIGSSGDQLIVNVSPQTLSTVDTVLKGVDVAPVTFNVYVHQDQANWLDQDNSDNVTYGTNAQNTSANNQYVQVMSGSSAFITMGSNVPVISSVSGGIWNPGVSYQREQVNQGILVEPQLKGNEVKLKIRRINNQVDNSNSQQINNQNVDTTTMIPLDQWVKLGSTGQADNSDPDSISYNAGANYQQKGTLYIKVSVVK
jgi:hypothetical protein